MRQLLRTFVVLTGLVALLAPIGGFARAPSPPKVLLQHTPVGIVMLPDGSYAFFDRDDPGRDVVLTALEGERVALTPKADFPIPPGFGRGTLLLDQDGELHEVYMEARGKGKPAVGLFIDLWQRRTSGGKARWEAPRRIWEGYTGALMEYVQLRSGRILVPFGKWIANRPPAPPTGCHVTTAVYSDDGGRTWRPSQSELTAPCYEGYNGNNYGACEPTVVQLSDDRVFMLMRTQAGFLYESASRDGAEWSTAAPSRFHASTGPPGLARLPDGAIVLFWNNCEMPPRVDGQGVYAGRDALHGAISHDDGRTWRGFREVYRDPYRNDTPPKHGDRGTAYPYGTFDQDGHLLVLSGQGRGRRNFVKVDPAWLMETSREDDFAHGLDGWHVFKAFGAARGYWRDRTEGARLVEHPNKAGARSLQIRRPDERDPDGAVWNFPLGWKGKLSLRLRINASFGGAVIALGDRMFEPTDDNGERLAMFRLAIDPRGRIAGLGQLQPETWRVIQMDWDLTAKRCGVAIEGVGAGQLDQAHPTNNGISYLRLRSAAERPDSAGFLVDWVRADVEDPAAPPRTAAENRAAEAHRLKALAGYGDRPAR